MGFGSLFGGLLTSKKRKKIARKMNAEYAIQAKAQKEAQRLGQLQANYAAQQERIQQLREGRIRQAAVIASGVAAGVGVGSSASQGGSGSAVTSAIGNASNIQAIQGYSGAISKQNEIFSTSAGKLNVLGVKMDTQNQKANMIGGIVDTAFSLATMPWSGASGAATSIFTK